MEIEAKFFDIDHDQIRARLRELGASREQPMRLMKRTIYDYEDLRLDKQAAWIRVRQEPDKTTMAFKQRQSETIEGMREIEFRVSDYVKACEFLEAIGLVPKAVQESKREIWKLDRCEVMLDEWPWIPPFVEVESHDQDTVKNVAEKLGLDYSTSIFDSADAVYQRYFDVSRTEISTVPIAFGRIPDWLAAKRKILNKSSICFGVPIA